MRLWGLSRQAPPQSNDAATDLKRWRFSFLCLSPSASFPVAATLLPARRQPFSPAAVANAASSAHSAPPTSRPPPVTPPQPPSPSPPTRTPPAKSTSPEYGKSPAEPTGTAIAPSPNGIAATRFSIPRTPDFPPFVLSHFRPRALSSVLPAHGLSQNRARRCAGFTSRHEHRR